jgi:hypothetical protein
MSKCKQSVMIKGLVGQSQTYTNLPLSLNIKIRSSPLRLAHPLHREPCQRSVNIHSESGQG